MATKYHTALATGLLPHDRDPAKLLQRAELPVSAARPRLHHLRTEQGRHEVDLITELGGGRLIGIEVKASGAPRGADARHLAWLREEIGDRFVAGIVLHTGPHVYELGERIVAAPICTLWG